MRFLWAIVLLGAVLGLHGVPTYLTAEDRLAIALLAFDLPQRPAAPRSYQQEIDLILDVQKAVFDAGSRDEAIPLDRPREPIDLVLFGGGFCFDRARTIEKMLAGYGMRTRHVALYARGGILPAWLKADVQSHALAEVKTQRGWMAIGTTRPWIGLDAAGKPVSVAGLASRRDRTWDQRVRGRPDFFAGGFTWVYGLYSRHGRFYPPYTPLVPDVAWRDLLANFIPGI